MGAISPGPFRHARPHGPRDPQAARPRNDVQTRPFEQALMRARLAAAGLPVPAVTAVAGMSVSMPSVRYRPEDNIRVDATLRFTADAIASRLDR
jgi:hypothetical protein